MAHTKTGNFPIAFRRGWSDWQGDLSQLIAFAKANQFEAVDFGSIPVEQIKEIQATGLKIGTLDLKRRGDLISADAAKRKSAAQENAQYIAAAVNLGVNRFFVCMLPEDEAKKRSENFDFAVDGFGQLCQSVASIGAKIVIEGWPGGGPHYPTLACTPADYREMLKRVNSPVLGVNFDPSHLVRMSIDPLRFVAEFARQIYHVHGKDTAIDSNELYEHGTLQPATFAKPHGFGDNSWRYTIPGRGVSPWTKMLSILKDAGYSGFVSIELEDEFFNSSSDNEKKGLIEGRNFLAGA